MILIMVMTLPYRMILIMVMMPTSQISPCRTLNSKTSFCGVCSTNMIPTNPAISRQKSSRLLPGLTSPEHLYTPPPPLPLSLPPPDTHTHVRTYVRIYMLTHIHTPTHTYVYIRAHRAHRRIHTGAPCTQTYTYGRTAWTWEYTYTHAYVLHTCPHTDYVHTHIPHTHTYSGHTHIRTHIHTAHGRRLGVDMSFERAQWLEQQYDRNGDGRMDFEEFKVDSYTDTHIFMCVCVCVCVCV